MNKLLVILFIGLTATASAQKSKVSTDEENTFRFGGKIGVNVNKISGQSYKDGFKYNFQIGGFVQYNFSNRFGIQPEVNFVQSTSELTDDANTIYDDIFRGGGQNKQKFNHLEIPLLLNINVGESKHVKLQIGPSWNGLLNDPVDSIKVYKKSDWSAIGGLWIQMPLIHVGARYKYGFANINENALSGDKSKWHNQSIQVFLGITF